MAAQAQNLTEVARLFLRLGFTGFGGPAAHIALMHDEVVKRRRWLDEQEFLDLVGATNLIPGPNSTELAIHLGYHRAGWKGLVIGGCCFILPATLIVLALAMLYVRHGAMPQVQGLMQGVKPVIIAIILQALWNLFPKACKNKSTWIAALAVVAGYAAGLNEIFLLFSAGAGVMLVENLARLRGRMLAIAPLPLALLAPTAAATGGTGTLLQLFLLFLKTGSILYGSGYVLLAFLRADFVERLGWLTDQQLIDAIAIGQVTPGPLFTTATFVGYLVGGTPGAVLATIGIFLPSFVFVAISNPWIPRLRSSPWLGSLLDGVNAASLALMAAVTFQLGLATLVDPFTILLSITALVLLLRYRINSTWLIAAGALAGILHGLLW